MEDVTLSLLRTGHSLCWCIYLGGSICMEVILKHAQEYLPGSQTAVVCQKSGYRYRWWSLACLLGLAGTGFAMLLARRGGTFDLQSTAGLLIISVALLWMLQCGILALLAFYFHPEMHLRVSSSMSAEDIRFERQRVGRAITRMAITVRVELGCALLAVALGVAIPFF